MEPDIAGRSDIALIALTRRGDMAAYAILHQRHEGSAMALARRMSRSGSDADDLVSEGFARVLAALQSGKGPDTAFRPYLLSTVRRLAYDRSSREQRERPTEETYDEPVPIASDPVVDGFEREAAAAAFSSLPERWRLVLWHTEVEGQSATEVGELLGMRPNAVAALAYRAREGLRQAYLSEHAPTAASGAKDCRRTTARLSAYVRGGLTPAREKQVREHLDTCNDCQTAYLELANVNLAMPGLISVAVLGGFGGTYLVGTAGSTTAAGTLIAGSGHLAAAPAGAGAPSGGPSSQAKWLGAPVAAAVVVAVIAALAIAGGGDDSVERADASLGSTAIDATAPGPSAPEPSSPQPGPGDSPPPTDGGLLDALGGGVGAATLDGPDGPPATTGPVLWPTSPTTPAPAPTPEPAAPTPRPASPEPQPQPPPQTVPPTPPPPPPPPPEPPVVEETSRLGTRLATAGGFVRGRPGVLTADVSNDGDGASTETTVILDLVGATLRGLPTTAADGGSGAGTAFGPALAIDWSCEVDSPARLRCSIPAIPSGSQSTLFIPVSVPADAMEVGASATASAANDDGTGSRSPSLTVPTSTDGFAARFATVGRAAVVTAGNSLLTCDDADALCAGARLGERDNGYLKMVEIDVDGDPTTANSSSSELTIPPGSTVLSATAYWSADTTAGARGASADPSRVHEAVIHDPTGARHAIEAERVDQVSTRYQAVADVTSIVSSAGAGRWTLGGIQVGTGENRYGGWSIVVAYGNAAEPVRSIAVLDGFSGVSNTQSVTFGVGGFLVPESGARTATLDIVAYEGDVTIAGDQLSVGGHPIVDASNPAGNTFNSTASNLGTPRTDLDPVWPNLLGFDLDRFDVADALEPGATSTDITFSTSGDAYLPGVLAFAVEL